MKKAYDGLPIAQVTKNLLRGKYAAEMTRKLITRVRERIIAPPNKDPMPWLNRVSSDLSEFCGAQNRDLWIASKEESTAIGEAAREKIGTIDLDLGGGGNFPLLYFLVRHLKPKNVVETGVAAGFTTQAILSAMEKNGSGRLFSSDFPYFRIKDPEKYIGFVVDDKLKIRWQLYIQGDKTNLPKIVSEIDAIDIFHYDSDKSYHGRDWAMKLILPRMRKGGVVVMDDLNDNCFFEDFVTKNKIDYKVFEFEGKHVGLFFK